MAELPEYSTQEEPEAWTVGYAAGRAEALEEAAEVADLLSKSVTDLFDQRVSRARNGEKNLELAAATASVMGHVARYTAQAIRALKG